MPVCFHCVPQVLCLQSTALEVVEDPGSRHASCHDIGHSCSCERGAHVGALHLGFARFGARAAEKKAAKKGKSEGSREIHLKLRELYKRVHPDLFNSQPDARKINEKSFKLLQVLRVHVCFCRP